MSRIRPQGALLYAGSLGLICADVLDADLSMRSGTLDVTSFMSPARQLARGPVEVTFTAQLTEEFSWDKVAVAGETPHLGALLAVARKHPEEYRRWREAEAVLKALDW